MLALDLEHYDYSKGSTSLIRATEGTILERIPPRVRIRSGAPLELPHILVLIDDPERHRDRTAGRRRAAAAQAVRLRPDARQRPSDRLLWSMTRHCRQQACRCAGPAGRSGRLRAASTTCRRTTPVLLFAMGDGNHSLATAKAIWEQIKPQVGHGPPGPLRAGRDREHPRRRAWSSSRSTACCSTCRRDFLADAARLLPRPLPPRALRQRADHDRPGEPRRRGASTPSASCRRPAATWPTSPTRRPTCRWARCRPSWMPGAKHGGFAKIDYVHGADVTVRLGSQPGNLGFYLPAIAKDELLQDRHRGRRPAAQDLLHGRSEGETLLHGSAADHLS